MKYTQSEVNEARETLLNLIKPGDTVFTVLRHKSASGMTREIGLVLIKPGSSKDLLAYVLHPNYSAARLLGLTQGSRDGIRVSGCGMDMGWHLVGQFSFAL